MTDYVVYDVFTQETFGGNPLAIIPDATGLSEELLPRIAREFNFSETTFVTASDNPDCDVRVRIFTPTQELAFAGHPTVGTALALQALGRVGTKMSLELGVGPIPVTIEGGKVRFVTRVPLSTGPASSVSALADCLGLEERAIHRSNHEPIEAGLGTNFTLVELTDKAVLSAASPNIDAFRKAAADPARLAVFSYVRNGSQIDARMFAPLGGILEDPATGSAAAALAAYLGKLDGRSQSFEISQGVQMGRPSRIEAEVVVEDGAPVAVSLAGHAVKVMEGRLTL